MAIIRSDAAGDAQEIPHEPGATMSFREIPWGVLEQASSIQTQQAIKTASAFAGSLKDLPSTAPEKKPDDIYGEYDKATILAAGIGAWSYEQDVTPETIAQLDHVTAEWAHRAILDLNMRSKAEGEG